MPVRRRRHARCENGLHVLRRVVRRCAHWKRTDFRYALPARRTRTGHVDRKKPQLPERFHNRPTWALGRFSLTRGQIRIQVPENWLLRQLSKRRIRCNPAPQLTCALANRLTALRKGVMGRDEYFLPER